MSIKDKFFKFLNEDEYEEDEDDFFDESELVHTGRVNRVVEEQDEEAVKKTTGLEEALRGKNSKVLVMEPKAYSESQPVIM